MSKVKKSFKDNPALQFITVAEEIESVVAEKPVEKMEQDGVRYKLNPLYVETKSKRVQLLVQPSLYDRIKKLAKSSKQSVNETIHAALQDYVERGGK